MTTTIKTVPLLFALNMTFTCSNANTPNQDATMQIVAATIEKRDESIIITGIVKKITSGKDGYKADVQTDKDGIYAVLVSSSNLGGPDNYKSCKIGDKVTFKGNAWGDKQLTVKQIISISTTQNTPSTDTHTQLLISPTGFRGIEVGDVITKHDAYTKKTLVKTGEGNFASYQITDFENNPAGYFMADPQNKFLVGDITVETPKAQTEKGIKIGDTYQDLLKVYPNIEVHGSESEGRTYATADNLSYRLDVSNFTQKLDKAKIPATAKITQIMIERFTYDPADLAVKYRELKSSYFIWQGSGVLELHAKPTAESKVEGKHFEGEMLSILDTKMINNQLWVKVTYNFKIKGGHEHRFADGQVMSSGEQTGWIGGEQIPIIRFK